MNAMSVVEIAGFATHTLVLLLGLGGVLGIIPLARGRRGGAGLILMAVAMTVLVAAPRLPSPLTASMAYVVGFLAALWLLLGPDRQVVGSQVSSQQTTST